MDIINADASHIEQLAPLFDLYRQFYQCPADAELAKQFISDRINNNESRIFVADDGGILQGFVQLYPSFCSVDAIKIYILYDLYVAKSGRGKGVGEALMNRAKAFATENGAGRIDLETAFDNNVGQRLYEKLGYKRVLEDFHTYSLPLDR
ncbi:hypothetical protein SIN8267_01046 [Sinobacterium norvegicum]|uniref:N-acetyltransferase domain-containing protein n=1 Tax=Sinobacterium norvegicum TaxID=1641715 RepID=A0ABM9ADC0_9GAMM|nr:GNAT family N-acetyltransferase [Sinobacterium norvegicum]CAH0990945.1 hypothetical protein SIN8267_01046 [Sinobacterium norvegicum]